MNTQTADSKTFSWPVQVYYEDTDSGGVVYHANYLNFMERTRTEWLRSLGLQQDELIEQYGLIFVVRSLAIDYLKPARFNQQLQVTARLIKSGRVSLVFAQTITHIANKSSSLLTTAEIKIASLSCDPVTGKIGGPKKIPPEIYHLLIR